jgi:hypothetical protein
LFRRMSIMAKCQANPRSSSRRSKGCFPSWASG